MNYTPDPFMSKLRLLWEWKLERKARHWTVLWAEMGEVILLSSLSSWSPNFQMLKMKSFVWWFDSIATLCWTCFVLEFVIFSIIPGNIYVSVFRLGLFCSTQKVILFLWTAVIDFNNSVLGSNKYGWSQVSIGAI